MNNLSILKYCFLLVLLMGLYSCAHYKDVPYFQNTEAFDGSKGAMLYDMRVKPKDQLVIFVFSGTDKEAVEPFNMRDPRDAVYEEGRIRVSASRNGQFHQYLVDNEGNIDFPILGTVHVGDMTLDSINTHIKTLIAPYLQPNTDCVVNTYIQNYNITVMGEVNRPNTFTLSRPQMTVVEALAMAGDMTIYGKRDNLKILRELSDGTYEVHELDMRDANILNSPYYYLQQRDIVYVEPNEVIVQNAKIGRTTQLWFRGASITISLGSLLYRVLR